jgi:hypothetical protein
VKPYVRPDGGERHIGMALTLLLHSLVVAFALVSCGTPSQKHPAKPKEAQAIQTEPIMVLTSTSANGVLVCQSGYYGVGLAAMSDGRVWMVADNGPAYRAGVREGDYLQGLERFFPDQFPVGTEVTFHKKVNGVWEPIKMKIERICRD